MTQIYHEGVSPLNISINISINIGNNTLALVLTFTSTTAIIHAPQTPNHTLSAL